MTTAATAGSLPGCLSILNRPLTEDDLLGLAASAGAYLSFHPAARFTGPPCRADWQFPAPEALFEEGRPDLRSDWFSLGVTLLRIWRDDATEVPPGRSVEYAQWSLDGHAARLWHEVKDVRPEVAELFAQCVGRARKQRPGTPDQLRALLLEVWPPTLSGEFPGFFLPAPKLTPGAWIAAARALGWWQVAALVITLGGLIAWLRMYAGG